MRNEMMTIRIHKNKAGKMQHLSNRQIFPIIDEKKSSKTKNCTLPLFKFKLNENYCLYQMY